MKIRIGAAGIHECSTKTMAGLDKLLTHVIEAAVLKKSKDEEPASKFISIFNTMWMTI